MNQASMHDIADITQPRFKSFIPSDPVRILLTVLMKESNLILYEHHL